jgi:HEAT repeat protein
MTQSCLPRLLTAACCLLTVTAAHAYVDLAPTLGRIVRESQSITIVEVDRFSAEKGVVVLKKVQDLKGETGTELSKHELIRQGESSVDRTILEWAEPGRRAVVFTTAKAAVVCLGEMWYQISSADEGWWKIGPSRPDLPLAYYGSISRLADAIPLMVAGKTAVITALPHGADEQGASYDLALNRASMPGIVRVERIRASLRMPDIAMGIGNNSAYVIGSGRAGADDIEELRRKLKAPEAVTKADSAVDLGFAGAQATEAAGDLIKLLDDEAPIVRIAAAAALLRIQSKEKGSLEVLKKGLESTDPAVRRYAARSTGLTGAAAAPLAGKLGELLDDKDLLVRRLALQSIATLGPAAADSFKSVAALLEQPELAIDAADALGRMGKAARPALRSLAKMLESDAATVRWAAVRAMSQIGGEDAAPAVKFMIKELPNATEVDGYNMLLYLSLLGPVAKDAIPAIRSSRVRNPVLRQIATWAIDPGTDLPWLGPGGPGGGPGGFGDVATFILEGYIQEAGDHLKPAAQALLKKVMEGTAGNVPGWGYKLLARFPDDTLGVLTNALADKELAIRERATVTLGYMGHAAAPAKAKVADALKAAQDESEQKLLRWCLREIE